MKDPTITLPETNIAPKNGWLEDFLVSFWDVANWQVLLLLVSGRVFLQIGPALDLDSNGKGFTKLSLVWGLQSLILGTVTAVTGAAHSKDEYSYCLVTSWWFDASENPATTNLRAGKKLSLAFFGWVKLHMTGFCRVFLNNIMWKCEE